MSRPKKTAEETFNEVMSAYVKAEWDYELHRLFYGKHKCFKCGSEVFKEALDKYKGLVVCCSDCPEIDEHN